MANNLRPVFHLPQNHLHLLLLLLLWPFILEAANPLYHICGSNGNYTAKSTYAENLSTLLSSFSSHISSTNGFYNLSSGKAYGRVNGIGLCRGDVDPSDCHACIKNSTLEIKRQCPNQKEAVIWYDNCMLRYSNQSIFGVIDWVDEFSMWNRDNVTSVAEFNQAMKELMGALSSRAAAGNSTLKFAIGKTAGPDSMTIYGLSQKFHWCLRLLSLRRWLLLLPVRHSTTVVCLLLLRPVHQSTTVVCRLLHRSIRPSTRVVCQVLLESALQLVT
ncbi:hypothetical protein SAY86_030943 [Trapa natans]|uniref:Gnk2-homologous domain-containing protein n=1 Tax=Trapa natans TaxID=22666 RepID=A0AAN7RD50_TRANT|nr:hypothetical protein SAY86_030943 [Trapa natans]